MAKLTAEQRNALPASDFVFPADRRFPIHDRAHAMNALARAAGKPEEAKVRAAVKARFPGIKAKKQIRKALAEQVAKREFGVVVPLWKDDSKQIVYGVVLSPGVTDSQGDVSTAEDIEKAAHQFLVAYRKHDVQHAEQLAGVETVESFIAPDDMTIAGEQVVKGAWVMATHVSDPDVWQRVQKGEITGYSIGGSGVRTPIAA
jgi:hypothetical protein